MSDSANKRKGGPGGGRGPSGKKSRGGNAGRWQTPHQKAKETEKTDLGTKLDVDDAGIWVTYARGMKGKAMREFKTICNQYGESLFGIKPPIDPTDEVNDEEVEQDIEASIKQELESFQNSQKPKTKQVFTTVSTGLECLFFMKTSEPVDPIKLTQQMCQDARDCPDPRERKTKYINRLTPIHDTDKASEKGIERVARSVLARSFELKSQSDDDQDGADGQGTVTEHAACTYAIRHNIRNHSTFKSDAVIRKIAGLVSPKHKVNLGKPDKVILVEIFQMYCGISVVDGQQWEELKRYNLNELYKLASETKKDAPAPADTTSEDAAKST